MEGIRNVNHKGIPYLFYHFITAEKKVIIIDPPPNITQILTGIGINAVSQSRPSTFPDDILRIFPGIEEAVAEISIEGDPTPPMKEAVYIQSGGEIDFLIFYLTICASNHSPPPTTDTVQFFARVYLDLLDTEPLKKLRNENINSFIILMKKTAVKLVCRMYNDQIRPQTLLIICGRRRENAKHKS